MITQRVTRRGAWLRGARQLRQHASASRSCPNRRESRTAEYPAGDPHIIQHIRFISDMMKGCA